MPDRPALSARLVGGVRSAAFAARVVHRTGLAGAVRLRALLGFARDARAARPGPHLVSMFHARMNPDKECLVDGARRLTWGEFDRDINRLAHALVERGAAGARVACMMDNCAEYLIAQQALVRIGATAVQIGYRSKVPEVAYVLGNAEPRAAIVAAAHLETFAAAQAAAGEPRARVIVVGEAPGGRAIGDRWDDALAGQPGDRMPAGVSGDGGGVIVYTSGTTGKPKGATRRWKQTGLESVADVMARVGMRHDERHLVVCPLYHSAAPAFVAIMMSLGATCVLAPHFEPEDVLALIARERITSTLMVPTMLVRLAAVPDPVRRRHDTRSLRWVMSAAAPLATHTAHHFQARFGPVLWNFYGATETGIVTLAGPDDHDARPGTVGRAVRGNQIRLLDVDGRATPTGQVGELYVRNSMLIAGYHRNPDATRQSMRDGFFSVGDLARVDGDGYYYVESRRHDMVISGGVNIYPREIEDHLLAHPAILDAAVIGVPDPEWGESLRAFVVVRPGHQLTEAAIDEHCRTALADFKRPRQVVFLDELPRNPTGKVLKRELRDRPL